jgi:membrane protein
MRGFSLDKIQLRASALTFYSLLSVVPVFAMLFGIAKGFGFEKSLRKHLLANLEGQEEVFEWILSFSDVMLEKTKGSVIAGIGIVVLLWAIIRVLGNIESSFNHVWGIKKTRPLGRKVTDYLSIMLICPILFVLSSAVTVVISGQVEMIVQRIAILGLISPAITLTLKLLPYCVIWTLFTFVFIFLPNTKVNFSSGVLAGILAGTLYQLFQYAYISSQIYVAKYNAIYGSFAALPLFILWLQISWLIVLFGAEISFAHQNVDTYEFEPDCLNLSHSYKRLLTLRIVNLLVKSFYQRDEPWNEAQISHKLEIPIRLVRQILFDLVRAGLVSEINVNGGNETAFQPALDPESMTIKYVIDAVENFGSDNIPVTQSDELKDLAECLTSFGTIIEKSPVNKLLKDI